MLERVVKLHANPWEEGEHISGCAGLYSVNIYISEFGCRRRALENRSLR